MLLLQMTVPPLVTIRIPVHPAEFPELTRDMPPVPIISLPPPTEMVPFALLPVVLSAIRIVVMSTTPLLKERTPCAVFPVRLVRFAKGSVPAKIFTLPPLSSMNPLSAALVAPLDPSPLYLRWHDRCRCDWRYSDRHRHY